VGFLAGEATQGEQQGEYISTLSCLVYTLYPTLDDLKWVRTVMWAQLRSTGTFCYYIRVEWTNGHGILKRLANPLNVYITIKSAGPDSLACFQKFRHNSIW